MEDASSYYSAIQLVVHDRNIGGIVKEKYCTGVPISKKNNMRDKYFYSQIRAKRPITKG